VAQDKKYSKNKAELKQQVLKMISGSKFQPDIKIGE
jgi:hypothetical protein